jgi:hypothetical protein
MPRSGLHVPLDVNFQDDAKVVQVSPEAELVYLRSLALAKRLDEDGAVHRAHLGRLTDKLDDRPDVLAKELVDVDLWFETETGWYIAAWAAHNTLTTERAEARAAEAKRKAEWRERQKMSQPDVPPDTETVSRVAPTSEVKRSTSEVKEQQQRDEVVHSAAVLLAQRRGRDVEAKTKDKPERWLAAAVKGIVEEISQDGYLLLVKNPQWTANELADALEPPKPGPMCGICQTENPSYCGDDCPLPPPLGELVDNVTSIKSIPRVKAVRA